MINWIKNKYIILIFILCIILFFNIILYTNNILYSKHSDTIAQYSFWKYFTKDTFDKYKELPLWNQYIFSGTPFLGWPHSAFFYPPFLLFLLLPTDQLIGYMFLIHLFIGGVFFYMFMRMLKLDKFSSFISSIIYIFSGTLITWIYAGVLSRIPTMLFPILLILTEFTIKKRSYKYAILTAITITFLFLGSHTQLFLYSMLVLFFYAMFRVFTKYRFNHIKKLGILFLLIGVISLLLSSIQLFPSFEISKYSTRQEGLDYKSSTEQSFPIQNLITLFLPNFFGSELNETYWGESNIREITIYFGILPLILLILALIFKFRDKNIIFFLLLAIFSIIFALGGLTPLYKFFHNFIPGFSLFRVPSRMLYFFTVSMAAISGFGANFLISKISNKEKLKLKKITVFLIIIFVILLISMTLIFLFRDRILDIGNNLIIQKYSEDPGITGHTYSIDFYLQKVPTIYDLIKKDILILSAILISTTIILILKIKNKMKKEYLMLFIFLAILIDLWIFALPFIDSKNINEVFSKTKFVEVIEKDKDKFRVFDLARNVPQHIAVRYNIENIGGYYTVILKNYVEFTNLLAGLKELKTGTHIPIENININEIKNANILNLLNVKYISSTNYTNKFDLIYKDKDLYIYENKNVLPRAFIVRNAKIIKDKERRLNEIKNFNPRELLILEEDFPFLNNEGEFKEVIVNFYSPNKISMNIDIENPGFLVLSEIWYPGWKAFDNGKEIKILKADHIFRSIYLEKGEHNIKFEYSPKTYKIGFIITLITLIISLAALLVLKDN